MVSLTRRRCAVLSPTAPQHDCKTGAVSNPHRWTLELARTAIRVLHAIEDATLQTSPPPRRLCSPTSTSQSRPGFGLKRCIGPTASPKSLIGSYQLDRKRVTPTQDSCLSQEAMARCTYERVSISTLNERSSGVQLALHRMSLQCLSRLYARAATAFKNITLKSCSFTRHMVCQCQVPNAGEAFRSNLSDPGHQLSPAVEASKGQGT